MFKKAFILTVVLAGFLHIQARAQFLSGLIINRYDRNAQHHGRWKYIDKSNKRRLVCIGRFDHGKQVGEWKYYHPTGQLRMLEKYTWQDQKRVVDVTFYHENGQISNRGIAIVESLPEKTHYHWEGEWAYYEEDGSFLKSVTYLAGQPVKSTYADGSVIMERRQLPQNRIEIPLK